MRHSVFLLGLTAIYLTAFSPNALAQTSAAPTKASKKHDSGLELQWIDKTVRPQDDFYRFVSGTWLNSAEIPADLASYDNYDRLTALSNQRLFDIIKTLAANKALVAGSNQQKIANLYHSFMDEAKAEALDIKPLQSEFARIDALSDHAGLPALIARLSILGVSLPLQAQVLPDAGDASRYTLRVSQDFLPLRNRDNYLKQEDAYLQGIRSAYLKHISAMLSMAGQAGVDQAAAEILALETELAKLQWTRAESRDPLKTYNKVEFTQLNEQFGGFDWRACFTAISPAAKVNYLIVAQPSFLSGLGKLLGETPLATLKVYLKLRVLSSYAPLLSRRFVDEDFAFTGKTLRGIPGNEARWKRAVTTVEEALPDALGQLYVEKYFPPQAKARMQVLVNNLMLAFRQNIASLSWMSADTKKEALTKLSKMNTQIGYPDKWRDYSKLQINKADLVGNVMRAQELASQLQWQKLGTPMDRREWKQFNPQTVNSYYDVQRNVVVFPAGMLQPPFFNAKADDAANYGGIGTIIAHEIGHGFDSAGSKADGDGNVRDWWTAQDKENFNKLGDAMVSQYNAYSPLPGYQVNGTLTLIENIADNIALSVAYKAYQNSLSKKPAKAAKPGKAAPKLAGFTGEQRFFMGWAQFMRGKSRDAETIRTINGADTHAPGMFRVNGTMSNLDEFYTAFGVKQGDKMFVAPEKRIRIW